MRGQGSEENLLLRLPYKPFLTVGSFSEYSVMCGIAGIVGPQEAVWMEEMNRIQYHRGPDDTGVFCDPAAKVSLGHRRLSILDLEGGKQPMANEDESLWIVHNGEIYNSPHLREHLVKKGHVFRTANSDTEVLLHLYEENSFDLLEDLNGMFAFVIYDKRRKLLFCARDRIGIKPFYYAHQGDRFAFASELKCLLSLPWISREIDFSSLYHYLSLQFVPAPDTIMRDIKKLPKGHFLVLDLRNKESRVEQFWDLRFDRIKSRSPGEIKEIVLEKMEEAVNRWTLSDVPIACSLSGGLDSSSVVGMMAKSGRNKVRTYSLGFKGEGEEFFDELNLARKVAEKWGTDHHELVMNPDQLLSDLEKMVWHLDEPYAGGLPSWYVFKLIGKDCKVAMTGTGGDELFGNYGKWERYEVGKLRRWWIALRELKSWGSWGFLRDAERYPHGHFYYRYLSDAAKNEVVFGDRYGDRASITEELLEGLWSKSKTESPRNAVAYVDFHLQLPEEFLHMTDRFSMAHSVEARVPFLDHELVELVFTIPPEIRTKRGRPKYLIRDIVKDLLPPELHEAPKRGFILPLPLWTRKELRQSIEEALSPTALTSQGLFSPQVWETIVRPHLSEEKNYTPQVWTLFMFQLWYERIGSGKWT